MIWGLIGWVQKGIFLFSWGSEFLHHEFKNNLIQKKYGIVDEPATLKPPR